MKPIHQTQFGGPDDPPEEMGNCYPACVASLLEVDLGEVPHVHAMHPTPEAAHAEMLRFLLARGFTSLCFDWAPWVHEYFAGALVVLSGKSPRGDWVHAVVGEVLPDGWRLVHDPHPRGTGIVGDPTHFQFVAPLLLAPRRNEGGDPQARSEAAR